MFQGLKGWWQERIIQRSLITDTEWLVAFQNLVLLRRLNDEEKIKLKRLSILFLHYKVLEGVAGLKVSTTMRLMIALQACLPILNLGLHWYDGFRAVILYPGAFSKQSIERDEYGIEHIGRAYLSGESWQRGPVVLSWVDSMQQDHDEYSGHNVVIHEFAHKLDMQNGRANGFPPLHKGMSGKQWTREFSKAYSHFEAQIQQQIPVPINPYAATSPAEFFAVFTELFFENPTTIKHLYPEIYELLAQFYQQDPNLNQPLPNT